MTTIEDDIRSKGNEETTQEYGRKPSFLERHLNGVAKTVAGALGAGALFMGGVIIKNQIDSYRQDKVSKEAEGFLRAHGANNHGVAVDVFGDKSHKVSFSCEEIPNMPDDVEDPEVEFRIRNTGRDDAELYLEIGNVLDGSGDRTIIEKQELVHPIGERSMFADFLNGPLKEYCTVAYVPEDLR